MSAQTTVEIGSLITRTPGRLRGCPRITGTGVSVRRVVIWYKQSKRSLDMGLEDWTGSHGVHSPVNTRATVKAS